ncbi:glycine cleavage system protein GcvH [Fastidiosibacter lacustris]|uniref:glycine cleavage system protein GcvH n=1 Tax=Fastidiosibacter lacustris TaxID=2056695 RepID=UPI000E351DE5|nr:glycine cleavage system protein GcvH [Fastidiosibacter lacustris]
MAEIRQECHYTKSHEWVRLEGDIAVCGIDDFAQSSSGELVFIELPEVDEEVRAGDDVCVVESVKAASDVYAPVSGVIIEVNEALLDKPSIVNESCYDDGWLFKIKMDDLSEIDDLLSAEEYAEEFDA